MHKMVLFSIAALASLVGAAIAQTPEPEPAWRKSALAFVPAGYVGGDAYRTARSRIICIGRPYYPAMRAIPHCLQRVRAAADRYGVKRRKDDRRASRSVPSPRSR